MKIGIFDHGTNVGVLVLPKALVSTMVRQLCGGAGSTQGSSFFWLTQKLINTTMDKLSYIVRPT
jgi:hypothetical protein